ncbi:major facilitator superfamily domain-containing protein [Tribonema minus]|uniref:Major facilitator superfamily domain-containing protein n=1 Tax=Tribonema minus TaxID=303371 RepID=A0A835YZE5_9STRA|nr:major facilitator superfamily domain-containing protein [Tribonema minus]
MTWGSGGRRSISDHRKLNSRFRSSGSVTVFGIDLLHRSRGRRLLEWQMRLRRRCSSCCLAAAVAAASSVRVLGYTPRPMLASSTSKASMMLQHRAIDVTPTAGRRWQRIPVMSIDGQPQEQSKASKSPARVALFTALACASIMVSYADRSNLATAVIPMSQQFEWTKSFEGTVLSSFFIGYALTQMLGGWLADTYGGRNTLIFGLVAWSAFTIATPLAASMGAAPLIAARIGLGLGEGFAFPSIHAMIAEGVPPAKQSTVVGAVTAASYVGAALAFAASPTLARNYGWESIFYVFGGASLFLGPAWLLFQPTAQHPHQAPTAEEDDEQAAAGLILPRQIDSAAVSTSAAEAPPSPQQQQQLQQQQEGGGLIGELAWYCRRREVQAILLAQFTQSVGMSGLLRGALLALGSALSALTLGGVSVSHLDIAPSRAGLIFGAGNTAGTLAGLVAVPLSGWLVDTFHNWDLVLYMFSLSYVIGAVAWVAWVGGEEIEYPPQIGAGVKGSFAEHNARNTDL